jgi:hypothetical protein
LKRIQGADKLIFAVLATVIDYVNM